MTVSQASQNLGSALLQAKRAIEVARDELELAMAVEELKWINSSPKRDAKLARVEGRVYSADRVLAAIENALKNFRLQSQTINTGHQSRSTTS